METEAMVIAGHGGPEVIERRVIELGELAPREVRVRVHAVALNHLDLWVRRGGPAFKLQFPHRLGSDVAGTVDALGPGVRGLAPGDRVLVQPGLSCGRCRACLGGADNLCRDYRILGENTQGGYARHLHVPDVNVVPIGDLGWVDAAAIPLVTVTAWQMVARKAEVSAGQTVVVNAAGSGVSTVLIQLCKLRGARVIATTRSRDKVERARALGADHVIVTSEQDLAGEVRKLSDKAGADVVFDHVGGELFEKSLAALRWGGRLVTCGATAGFHPKIDLRTLFFKQIEVRGSTMGSKADLLAALPLYQRGVLRPQIDRTLPLWQAPEAHAALEAAASFGKIVLTVD